MGLTIWCLIQTSHMSSAQQPSVAAILDHTSLCLHRGLSHMVYTFVKTSFMTQKKLYVNVTPEDLLVNDTCDDVFKRAVCRRLRWL